MLNKPASDVEAGYQRHGAGNETSGLAVGLDGCDLPTPVVLYKKQVTVGATRGWVLKRHRSYWISRIREPRQFFGPSVASVQHGGKSRIKEL